MTSNIILQARGLKKYYGSGETQVRALDGVNLDIERGKFTAIIGTSGSGQIHPCSTCWGGWTPPPRAASRWAAPSSQTFPASRPPSSAASRSALSSRNYNLVPVLSVWENIIFPISLDGRKPDKNFIMQIVSLLGLQKKLDSLPNNLSGGQQQRVAIARALASKPSIILADEPDRQPRLQDQRRCRRPAQDDQPTVPSDHCDDYPQPRNCRPRPTGVIRIEDGQIVAN